jgi:hypothetical protein
LILEENPFLGVTITRPVTKAAFKLGPLSFGVAPVMPQMLVELSAGRGTLRDVARDASAAGEAILFDFRPSAATSDTPMFASVAAYRVPGIPELQLVPRTRFTFGIKPVEFPAYPRFTKRFMLLANDEAVARRIISGAVLDACEALPDGPGWQLQSGSGWLLVASGATGEVPRAELARSSARIAAALQESVRRRESFA